MKKQPSWKQVTKMKCKDSTLACSLEGMGSSAPRENSDKAACTLICISVATKPLACSLIVLGRFITQDFNHSELHLNLFLYEDLHNEFHK